MRRESDATNPPSGYLKNREKGRKQVGSGQCTGKGRVSRHEKMEVGKEEAASERKEWKGSARQVEKQWCKISIPEADHLKREICTCREKKCKVEASHLHPTENTHLRVTLRNDWA